MTRDEAVALGVEYFAVPATELVLTHNNLGWSIDLDTRDGRNADTATATWHTGLFVSEPSDEVHMIPEYPPLGSGSTLPT